MRNYKKEYQKAIKNKVNLSLKVDRDLYEDFKARLKKNDKTINEVITQFIKEYE